MCFGGSRDVNLQDLAPAQPIARPHGGTSQQQLPEMTGQQIQVYLSAVARYLRDKRQSLTLVGVGGVLSTMVLRIRASTHDVDVLSEHCSPEQTKHLRAAIRKVAKQNRLEEGWLNNQTVLHIPARLRGQIQQDAIRQNDIIFEQPGLKIVAAPWMYCFASKLHRISGSGMHPARGYDASDAANFLLKHLRNAGRRSMSVSEIITWLERYGIRIQEPALSRALRAVNAKASSQIIV